MKKYQLPILSLLLSYQLSTAQNPFGSTDLIKIQNEKTVNSNVLDFSPAFHEDGIVFVSSHSSPGIFKMLDPHLNHNTMTFLMAKRGADGTLQKPVRFAHELATHVHEGPMTFDKTGETIFFCRNNSQKGKVEYVNGVSRMKIYSSKKEGKKWSSVVDLPFNQDESDNCHPSISVDGNRLYFASNREGGFGGMDIYYVEWNGKTWGKPVNLGASVNTAKNEVFPFVHADGTVFFSSNGHSGSKGGLDIYFIAPNGNEFGKPMSLGAPFNSNKDDFGFIVDADLKNGYFTSNRDGGLGEDDIYSFSVTEGSLWDAIILKETPNNAANAGKTSKNTPNGTDKPTSTLPAVDDPNNLEEARQPNSPNRLLDLLVIDRATGEPIEQARVTALNLNQLSLSDVFAEEKPTAFNTDGTLSQQVLDSRGTNFQTDFNGKSILKTNRKGAYLMNVAKEGYIIKQVKYKPEDPRTTLVVMLERGSAMTGVTTDRPASSTASTSTSTTYESGTVSTDDLVFVLKNVYYNYNDATIRPDAHRDLNKLVSAMKRYPDMTIELSSHTDCRGTDGYNIDLSQRRANNATAYLIARGIEASRIRAVGLGETKLQNECADGTPCSEKEHQRNRRTEVRIIHAGAATGKVSTESQSYDSNRR